LTFELFVAKLSQPSSDVAGWNLTALRIHRLGRCMSTIAIEPNVYYTLDEVAQLLRVSRAAAIRLIKSGQAPSVQVGRQRRVLGAALLNLGEARSESEVEYVRDWWGASNPALREVWDNDEDAVYDQL